MNAVVTIEARPGWEGRDSAECVVVRGGSPYEAVRGVVWELASRGFEYEAVWVRAMMPSVDSYRAPYVGISVTLHTEVAA